MAIAFVQKATASGNAVFNVGASLTGVTAGNFLLINIAIVNDPVTLTVSGGTNSYTQRFSASNGGRVYQYYAENVAAGSVTVNVEGDHSFFLDMFVSVAEFSGVATSGSASGTASTNTGVSNAPSTGSTTPGSADCLFAAIYGGSDAATVTENAGGQGFTLLHELESGAGSCSGSSLYKIISGSAAQSESWSLSGTRDWSAGVGAYKPAGTTTDSPSVNDSATITELQKLGIAMPPSAFN